VDNTFTDLTDKQVINVCDGKMLGYIVDLQIEITNGRICAIILPGEKGTFGFKKCTDVIIPWEKICRIGEDAILVDIGILPSLNECEKCGDKKKRPHC
jgi:YlmC/YmxH family sporulation protein